MFPALGVHTVEAQSVRDLVANGSPIRRIRDEETVVAADRGNDELFDNARKNAARKMRKRFAPEMIVQCVEAAVNLGDFDAGIKVEQECFGKCLNRTQEFTPSSLREVLQPLYQTWSLGCPMPQSCTCRLMTPTL